MKKYMIVAAFLMFTATGLMAQENSQTFFPTLGSDAPAFQAESTTGTVNFPADYGSDWKILFSHPADFTPVCTSEILELAEVQSHFNKLGTKIVVVSVDPLETHIEWKKSMESISFKDRKPASIDFPLVSDQNLSIARKYGMIQPSASSTKDVRGVYIIDPKNKIRAMFFYPMDIGRNTGEIERTLVALQTADKRQVLIPANWQPGGDVLLPYVKTPDEAAQLTDKNNPDYYQLTWYMMYKKESK